MSRARTTEWYQNKEYNKVFRGAGPMKRPLAEQEDPYKNYETVIKVEKRYFIISSIVFYLFYFRKKRNQPTDDVIIIGSSDDDTPSSTDVRATRPSVLRSSEIGEHGTYTVRIFDPIKARPMMETEEQAVRTSSPIDPQYNNDLDLDLSRI